MLNPIDHPVCVSLPDRLSNVNDFHPHLPVAMLFISLLRPSRVVELGCYLGDSLCAFAQAARELSLPTKVYGIDTWKGDANSGHYGEDVIMDLRRFLGQFGYMNVELIRSLTHDAAAQFADDSIDLLHIDADHTYEGVKADFEDYLPKLSPQGVVLFHDIATVHNPNLHVWKYWPELKLRYPGRWFEFPHSWGVGVLCPKDIHVNMRSLLSETEPKDIKKIQAFFTALGNRVMDHAATRRSAAQAMNVALQK